MLKLFIPKHLLQWIDDVRGEDSRAVFIINTLCSIKDQEVINK